MSDTAMDCPGVNALETSVVSSVNRLSIMYMSWEQQVGCDDDDDLMSPSSNFARAAK
jgi:hypothetical protein